MTSETANRIEESLHQRYLKTKYKYKVWICLPGYLDEPDLFEKLAKLLPSNVKLVGWKSPTISEDNKIYNIEELVESLEKLRIKIKVKKFSVLGFSLGGLVAIKYCHNYPERAEKLVVLSSMPVLIASDVFRRIFQVIRPMVLRREFINFWTWLSRSGKIRKLVGLPNIDSRRRELLARFGYSIQGTLLGMLGENLIEEYNLIKVPKVIINFQDDQIMRWNKVRRILPKLNGEIVVEEKGGHATGEEYWEKVAELLVI